MFFTGLIVLSLVFCTACKEDTPTDNGDNDEEVLEPVENYRPFYHLTPPFSWQSDPTGMVYYDETYHISYIHNPEAPVHGGNQHWRKATSLDLMHWEDHGVILEPGELGRISSGSAVVDRNNTSGLKSENNEDDVLVIMFTSNGEVQQQSLAYSNDKGYTWTKYEGNPVLSLPAGGSFRDPKVSWYEPREKWIQVVTAGDRIKIYSSDNLIDWDFESDFGPGIGDENGVWECPDLFYLETEDGDGKWVLLVSVGGSSQSSGINGGSSIQYFIGDFDGYTFTNENSDVLRVDYGIDNYAGVTWSNIPEEDGRRIFIGWMSNWYYAEDIPEHGWRGSMTIPREVALRESDGGYYLAFSPVRELDDQMGQEEIFKTPQGSILLEDNDIIKTGSYRIRAELNLSQATSFTFDLGNKSESLSIQYNKNFEQFTIRRGSSGVTGFNDLFSEPIETNYTLTGDALSLEILVDKTSVELFINGGEKVMTALFFPRYKYNDLEVKGNSGSMDLIESLKINAIQRTIHNE